MTSIILYTAYVFISVGVLFNLLAAISLLRFSDVYARLSASTKAITFGTSSIVFGVFLIYGFSAIGIKALLCLIFILLTSPIEAHVLLRAAKKAGINPRESK